MVQVFGGKSLGVFRFKLEVLLIVSLGIVLFGNSMLAFPLGVFWMSVSLLKFVKSPLLSFSATLFCQIAIFWLIGSVVYLTGFKPLDDRYYFVFIESAFVLIGFIILKVRNSNYKDEFKSFYLIGLLVSLPYIYFIVPLQTRIASFIVGWDNVGGHLYVSRQIILEGFIRTFPADYISFSPKAFHSLVILVGGGSTDSLDLINAIQAAQNYLILVLVMTVYVLVKGNFETGMNLNVQALLCSSAVGSALLVGWAMWMGYGTIISATAALITVIYLIECDINTQIKFYLLIVISIVIVQSWTLMFPVVLLILLTYLWMFSRTSIQNWVLGAFAVILHVPSIVSIYNYTNLNQFSEGSRFSGNQIIFLIALNVTFLVVSIKNIKGHVIGTLALCGVVLLSFLIALVQHDERFSIPYYSMKLFWISTILGICLMPPFINRKQRRVPDKLFLTFSATLVGIFAYVAIPIPGTNVSMHKFLIDPSSEWRFQAKAILVIAKESGKETTLVYSGSGADSRSALFQNASGISPSIPGYVMLIQDKKEICSFLTNNTDVKVFGDEEKLRAECKKI
jgi:hypothetical protein